MIPSPRPCSSGLAVQPGVGKRHQLCSDHLQPVPGGEVLPARQGKEGAAARTEAGPAGFAPGLCHRRGMRLHGKCRRRSDADGADFGPGHGHQAGGGYQQPGENIIKRYI